MRRAGRVWEWSAGLHLEVMELQVGGLIIAWRLFVASEFKSLHSHAHPHLNRKKKKMNADGQLLTWFHLTVIDDRCLNW